MVLCLTISSGRIGIWSSRRGGNQNTGQKPLWAKQDARIWTQATLVRGKSFDYGDTLAPHNTGQDSRMVLSYQQKMSASYLKWLSKHWYVTGKRCYDNTYLISSNKHSSSNKRPPSNKHPTPRPLYQIRAPLPHDSVPHPFPLTFLKK